ncbi:MAG TPA: hypothetical protein VFS33_05790 [Gemmatimonadales bacterium]|nr:hypothetical protein [Gemmatimonadales bacterium]
MATICTTLELRHVVAQASRDGYPVLILALSGQHHGLEVHWLQLSTAETPYLRVVAHMAVSELLAKVGGRCLLPLPMLSESDAVDLMASGSRGAREWVFRKYLQSR